ADQRADREGHSREDDDDWRR
ncbi:MAG: DUF3073 domain-containing protein, partial [Rhodococcus sp. (in: high G+C Gram-positive bacteria)]